MLSIHELEELKREVEIFLADGRIVPYSSVSSARILFAKKKDGGLHMYIDY